MGGVVRRRSRRTLAVGGWGFDRLNVLVTFCWYGILAKQQKRGGGWGLNIDGDTRRLGCVDGQRFDWPGFEVAGWGYCQLFWGIELRQAAGGADGDRPAQRVRLDRL